MVVDSLRLSIPIIDNLFTTEALFLFHATWFCKEIGITQLIIGGDALQVVNLLKSNNAD